MRAQRVLGMLLSLALLLGLTLPAAADDDGPILPRFVDLADDDWSRPYILEMWAKGLMQGTGNGRFEPNAPLTRAQAVTVAIRLMGLDEEAPDEDDITNDMLPFSDRKEIPDWAKPYVAVAVDEEILPAAEDGLLRPNEQATRLWVSVLLVRALGYDAEAQAKMTTDLSFRDDELIPESLVGYVAAAVDHELVQGFPDRSFRPNDPLTRAQAAALLSRTDSQLGEIGRLRPGFLVGILQDVNSRTDTLTIRVRNDEEEVRVASGAAIFLDDEPVRLSELPEGARLSIVLNESKRAVLVIARSPVPNVETNRVEGKITALLLPEEMAGGLGLVTVDPDRGSERSFPLAPRIAVTYQNRSLDLEDLRVGDEVEVEVAAGVAVAIDVTKRSDRSDDDEDREDTIKGTITDIRPYSIDFLGSLDVKTSRRTETVRVAPGAVISRNGRRVQLTDLRVGDRVTVRVASGVAIRITVDQPVKEDREEEVKGVIEAVYPYSTSFQSSIVVKTSRDTRTIPVASDATIDRNGRRVSIDALREGDEVTVKLVNDVATRITVTKPVPEDREEEIRGVIEAVYPISISFQASIDVKTSRGIKTLPVASDATITREERRVGIDQLREGDEVTVKLVNDVATRITVTRPAPEEQSESIKGELTGVYPFSISFEARVEVKTGSKTRTLPVAPEAVITREGRQVGVDALQVGDKVTIRVEAGVATRITVEEPVAIPITEFKAVIIGIFGDTLTLRTERGREVVYRLADDAELLYKGRGIEVDDLYTGDEVEVKVRGLEILRLKVEDRLVDDDDDDDDDDLQVVKGTVRSISSAAIRIRDYDGKEHRFRLSSSVKLRRGDASVAISRLDEGDKVILRVKGDLVVEIDIED